MACDSPNSDPPQVVASSLAQSAFACGSAVVRVELWVLIGADWSAASGWAWDIGASTSTQEISPAHFHIRSPALADTSCRRLS